MSLIVNSNVSYYCVCFAALFRSLKTNQDSDKILGKDEGLKSRGHWPSFFLWAAAPCLQPLGVGQRRPLNPNVKGGATRHQTWAGVLRGAEAARSKPRACGGGDAFGMARQARPPPRNRKKSPGWTGRVGGGLGP